MWRSLSLAPAPLAILHALPSAVAAAATSTCLRAPALQHPARAVAHSCGRSFHSRASERAPTLLHSRVPVRCASLFPSVRPAVAIRRASPPAAVPVAATSLHTSAPTCALNFARRMRFFSRTCNPVAAPPPGADAELAAAAACDTLPSAPNLFDASHLLSNLEDKRENLHFLEVSADGGHHRDVCFSRGELSSTLELHPRDLRFLDASMRNLPSILARKKVIIVNLEMFKALITADRVLMYDTWYPHVKGVVQPMQASVLNGGEKYDGQPVPFEFIALEHILLTVCRNLEQRFEIYLRSLAPLLSDSDSAGSSSDSLPSISMLSSGGDPDNGPTTAAAALTGPSAHLGSSAQLNSLIADGSGSTLMHLLQLKNALTSFEVTLRETGGALRDLLETDEDMAQMYLTQKARSGSAPPSSEHGEVEVILETYLRKVDELENEVEQMVKSISLTEEHIQIRLDSTRNSMMKLELLTSIGTFGVTSAALGAALFGMNVPNGFENTPTAFVGCTAVFMLLAGLIVRKGLHVCRKRNIHLLQIEPQEPAFKFPYAAADGAANGLAMAKNKRGRLAKLASLQSRGVCAGQHDRSL